MAAITLGVAEVEERLRTLRRRLNVLTLQHGMYLSLSAVVLAATLLFIAALRVSPQTFAVAAWGGGVVGAGIALGGLLWARRRWVDISKAALLADHRGQLADRLATLVDLRARPRTARLAPVLVGQILALGSRWQPSHVAPRRIPRSLYVLIATLLCLAATLYLARHPRTPSAPTQTAPATVAQATGVHAPASAARQGGQQAAPSGGVQATAPDAVSDSGAGQAGAPSLPDEREGGEAPTRSLPGRLQQAIRHAFNPEAPDDTPPRLAQSEITSGDSGGGKSDRDSGDRNRGANAAHNEHGIPEPESGRNTTEQTHSSHSPFGETATQNRDAAAQTFQGASPAAGSGSNPEGLLAAPGGGPALGEDGPKTFKLTITSFLRGAEQPGQSPARPGKQMSAGGASRTAPGADAALSDRQMNDAALRKAEIPAEYEDIVRRVYSLRADQ